MVVTVLFRKFNVRYLIEVTGDDDISLPNFGVGEPLQKSLNIFTVVLFVCVFF